LAKNKTTVFECQACGFQTSRWSGKCTNCGAWDSFSEVNQKDLKVLQSADPAYSLKSKPTPITEVEEDSITRFGSGESEFDTILGGGVVPGSLVLIGGSPGVGKSTLLLKVAGSVARSGKKVLYVSGEESGGQIKLRANRLNALHQNLHLLNEIKMGDILNGIRSDNYEAVVIDSIQTIYSEEIASSPGSVSQVREITFELLRIAKEEKIAIFIIGHITKDGSIAGPRILEHMVDTVLYFEGESSNEIRLLRSFKNRFGTTSEIGIFRMDNNGLESAKSIGKLFFSRHKASEGSAATVIMEGSRALALEVQALVSEMSYGAPKRSATGFDTNRLNMLIALLEKKIEIPLNRYDVFLNISGGVKISDTSADLAVIAAIVSSFRKRALSQDSIFLGEVSLIGDVREISNIDIRLKEASTLGFEKAIIPKKPKQTHGIKCFEADDVVKILEWM